MTSWTELAEAVSPAVVKAKITFPYGRVVEIPIVTLTFHEWVAIQAEVPDPAIPRTLVDKSGNKQPNPSDATYVRKMLEVSVERNNRRLALALEKAGIKVPGTTSEEKAATIQSTFDAGVANRLIALLGEAALGGQGRLLSSVDTFRSGTGEASQDSDEA